jgi:FkbM family methyltransferase
MMVGALELEIEDHPTGDMREHIAKEVIQYRVDEVPWRAGDVMVDIGAHVGMVSIYVAKRHPEVTVYAYEPEPSNYRNLLANIEANGTTNVIAHPYAISAKNEWLDLVRSPETNSGGASACVSHDNGEVLGVPAISLAQVLEDHRIDRVRLLKIDCEGMEYEILEDAPLDRVDYFVGEFHRNQRLVDEGHDLDALAKKVKASVGTFLCLSVCGMAD